jgi:hypothetical protein
MELREVMWEERPLRKMFFNMDYGGPHSSRMKMHMINHAMSIKEWVIHHDEMNYHFNQFELYKHLRNGRLTSFGRSTP